MNRLDFVQELFSACVKNSGFKFAPGKKISACANTWLTGLRAAHAKPPRGLRGSQSFRRRQQHIVIMRLFFIAAQRAGKSVNTQAPWPACGGAGRAAKTRPICVDMIDAGAIGQAAPPLLPAASARALALIASSSALVGVQRSCTSCKACCTPVSRSSAARRRTANRSSANRTIVGTIRL